MTSRFIADLPDPNAYQSVGWFVLTAGAVLGVILLVLQIVRMFRPTPPIHQQYATKDELRALESRFASLKVDFDQAFQRHDEKLDFVVVRIHERIDELSKTQTERLIGVIKEMNR